MRMAEAMRREDIYIVDALSHNFNINTKLRFTVYIITVLPVFVFTAF